MSEPSMSWNRVLPKPPALYQLGDRPDQRSYSVFQHHIVPIGEPTGLAESPRDRRNTIHGFPQGNGSRLSPPISQFFRAYPINVHDDLSAGPIIRKRAASLMAEESSPREASPASETNSNPEPTNQFCLCQPEPKIPRPRNAFILYRQHHQAAVVAQNPGLANPDISKIIGEQWKRLPEKQKSEWKALAEEEKARHQQQYPDYRYQPRRYNRNGLPITGTSTAPSNVGPTGHCTRCGGKVMNPPTTPNGPPSPITPAGPPMSAVYPGAPSAISHTSSRYGTVPAKRPGDFGKSSPPPYQRHNYGPYGMIPQTHQIHHPHATIHENRHRDHYAQGGPMSPPGKRRRFNGDNVYIPPRPEPGHPPQTPYPYTAAGRRPSLPPPEAIHPRSSAAMGPLATARGVPQPPNTATRPQPLPPPPPPTATRTDPSLTLPPLQTSNVDRDLSAQQQHQTRHHSAMAPAEVAGGGGSSTRENVERTVREIPVLNKIKTLSRAAPSLSPSSLSQPIAFGGNDFREKARGALLAVEGPNIEDVNYLSRYLMDFLLKDGSFDVRKFEGSNLLKKPTLEAANVEANEGGHGQDADLQHDMTIQYLNAIAGWHKVSKDLIRFIYPSLEKKPGHAAYMRGDDKGDKDNTGLNEPEDERESRNTEEGQHTHERDSGSISPKTIPAASNIPPKTPHTHPSASAPPSQVIHLSSPTQASFRPSPSPSSESPHLLDQSQLRPIALISSYQLSSADAAASSIPCLDSYTPHDHWQWVAALFRGCIGPDVTVVVREFDDDGKDGEALPMPVEVRLGEGRKGKGGGSGGELNAVVIRKAKGERFDGRDGKGEKALRRVGFEVVEFLRR